LKTTAATICWFSCRADFQAATATPARPSPANPSILNISLGNNLNLYVEAGFGWPPPGSDPGHCQNLHQLDAEMLPDQPFCVGKWDALLF
jgi:hypothetical protein